MLLTFPEDTQLELFCYDYRHQHCLYQAAITWTVFQLESTSVFKLHFLLGLPGQKASWGVCSDVLCHFCSGAWGFWPPLSDFIHCVSTLLWPKCDSISTENNHLSWFIGRPYLNPVPLFTLLSASCPHQGFKPQSFRNPYDIPRSHLLDQLSRMRRNLLNTSVCNLRGQDSGKSVCLPLPLLGLVMSAQC